MTVDPAITRDVDGYPGLVYAVGGMTEDEADRANGFTPCACGDPGDCSGCGA